MRRRRGNLEKSICPWDFTLPLTPVSRHVVCLNRTRGRDLDRIELGVCYHGGCAWKGAPHGLNARGKWNRLGIWSGGIDDAIAYVGWHKGNRSTNQGISREPTLPTNKFSPRPNLRRAPSRHPPCFSLSLSLSLFLSPYVTLWGSRDLVSRGWKSGPRCLISIVGRTIGHRLPF